MPSRSEIHPETVTLSLAWAFTTQSEALTLRPFARSVSAKAGERFTLCRRTTHNHAQLQAVTRASNSAGSGVQAGIDASSSAFSRPASWSTTTAVRFPAVLPRTTAVTFTLANSAAAPQITVTIFRARFHRSRRDFILMPGLRGPTLAPFAQATLASNNSPLQRGRIAPGHGHFSAAEAGRACTGKLRPECCCKDAVSPVHRAIGERNAVPAGNSGRLPGMRDCRAGDAHQRR